MVLATGQQALREEWERANPRTPEEVADRLVYVVPRMAANDVSNGARTHIEPPTQRLGTIFARAEDMQFPNLANLVLSEFGRALPLASRNSLRFAPHPVVSTSGNCGFGIDLKSSTALFDHVSHVVGVASKKQVVRANTRAVITVMKNVHAIWNGAVSKFPRYAMGQGRRQTTGLDIPIAVGSAISTPRPTIIALGYARPKTGSKVICGMLDQHGDLLRRCATPPAVRSSAEALPC